MENLNIKNIENYFINQLDFIGRQKQPTKKL